MQYVIDVDAFKEAVAFAEKKHGGYLASDMLESLIRKMADKKQGMPFDEAKKYSLNELCLVEIKKRKRYECAASKYFSLRSVQVRKARATKPAASIVRAKRKIQSITGNVFLEKKGQYAFKV